MAVRKIDGCRSSTRVIARKTRMRAIIDGRQILCIPARPRSENWSGGCAGSWSWLLSGQQRPLMTRIRGRLRWKTANRSGGSIIGCRCDSRGAVRFAEHTYQWPELAD